jgi:cytochrome c oxidase subunit 1
MLFSVGFMLTFLLGGLSGVMLASPPLDFHVTDTYFLVAHFHYVLFGTIVFATYAGIYFWFPKMTGRFLDETWGKVHFWLTFESPMLWSIGFLITFTFGGLTGVILASPPLDFHVSDTYFVVAHFHYVVFGTVVFAMFAGFYFWWPKWTGKMLNDRLGKWHFWLLFIGFHTTFLIQHWLGVVGMPRRYATYLPSDGFTWMNQVSSAGAGILAISMIPFFVNVYLTARNAPKVTVNDPWGYGRSLEWATSCPPPRHNFTSIPRIRSESPAFDLNHPEAGIPIGIGAAKDAPQAPVHDIANDEVR